MALALNVFRTITEVVQTNPVGIYTAPVGYTGVILLAQAANIGGNSQDITLAHVRSKTGIAITTELFNNFPIPAYDSANLLAGKLVLEQGDSLKVSSSTNTDVKFVVSVLETINN
jgi:hypothetical protein